MDSKISGFPWVNLWTRNDSYQNHPEMTLEIPVFKPQLDCTVDFLIYIFIFIFFLVLYFVSHQVVIRAYACLSSWITPVLMEHSGPNQDWLFARPVFNPCSISPVHRLHRCNCLHCSNDFFRPWFPSSFRACKRHLSTLSDVSSKAQAQLGSMATGWPLDGIPVLP